MVFFFKGKLLGNYIFKFFFLEYREYMRLIYKVISGDFGVYIIK